MPTWLAFSLVALAFAAGATWVSRRLLDTQVGWVRSVIISLVVFSLSIPLVLWMLEQSHVYADGKFLVSWPVVTTFFALILGWVFAVVVVVIVISEFLVPTRPLSNPIVIEGHTDAAQYSGRYSNWELSADRANAARRVLEDGGLGPARIVEVRGMADRQLRNADNPLDPRNRRITIFLPFTTKLDDDAAPPTPPDSGRSGT